MRNAIIPTCAILLISAIICFFVAREYYIEKHNSNPIFAEKEEVVEEVNNESDDISAVSVERVTLTDTVVIVKKDLTKKEITLRNINGGEPKSLRYDGATVFTSRRMQPMTPEELKVGEIAEVTFTTYNKEIKNLKLSDEYWENKKINRFVIDEKKKTLAIGEDDLYELDSNIFVGSGDGEIPLMEITNLDNITIKGKDSKIYSIIVEDGHGYIRVVNDYYFTGGWIEIGQDIIKVLTEDMLIPVPEGKYDIVVTNKGYTGRTKVTVERDKEAKLDLSEIDIEETAVGHVQFTIDPAYAQLYIDGVMTDYDDRIALEYGIHSLRAQLAGYETINSNFKVNSEFSNIKIILDKDESDTSSSSSSSTSSSTANTQNNSSSTASVASSASTSSSSASSSTSNTVSLSDNKKIFVEGPQGVEVYLDGTYIGIAPCSTLKVTGSHTITLSKSGYKPKTYTVNVSNDEKDLTLSFSELTTE